jgi:periplasmic divalent cation tolerance protein
MERPLLVYTTFPDAATALDVGEALVRARLAACVNVIPGMQSVYAWKGAVERGTEVVAILKSREPLADALATELKRRHPYETPIILHLPVSDADPDTAAWIRAETGPV